MTSCFLQSGILLICDQLIGCSQELPGRPAADCLNYILKIVNITSTSVLAEGDTSLYLCVLPLTDLHSKLSTFQLIGFKVDVVCRCAGP